MNTKDIVNMTAGLKLPHRPNVLPSLIGISMIGPKNIPSRVLRGLFQVRRHRVLAALVWLKENNHLYAKVVIDEGALQELPLAGVPDDLSSIIRHTSDADMLERERKGYVPDDPPEFDDTGKLYSY